MPQVRLNFPPSSSCIDPGWAGGSSCQALLSMRGKLDPERGGTTLPSDLDSIMPISVSLPSCYFRVSERWSLLKNLSTRLLALGIPCFFDLFTGTHAHLGVPNSTLLGGDTVCMREITHQLLTGGRTVQPSLPFHRTPLAKNHSSSFLKPFPSWISPGDATGQSQSFKSISIFRTALYFGTLVSPPWPDPRGFMTPPAPQGSFLPSEKN